ncbi:nucleotide triphosphate diphosphatase NUDT15 [Chitinophaga agrisoli]|nr:NUDIX domain-containing protein [Chitinophaga agrisoli]
MQFKIGIGVIIHQSGKVLMGLRAGSHGANTWSCPGGHMEAGEIPEITAKREVFEETGLVVDQLCPCGFTYDHFEEIDTDYLTLFYSCECEHGTPVIMEKEKCLEWRWVYPDALPQPLFKPVASLMAQGGL